MDYLQDTLAASTEMRTMCKGRRDRKILHYYWKTSDTWVETGKIDTKGWQGICWQWYKSIRYFDIKLKVFSPFYVETFLKILSFNCRSVYDSKYKQENITAAVPKPGFTEVKNLAFLLVIFALFDLETTELSKYIFYTNCLNI